MNSKFKIQNLSIKTVRFSLVSCLLFFILFFPFSFIHAQTDSTTDINSSSFKLLVCDGPELPAGMTPPKTPYVPCNFAGLMLQLQHLINIAIIVGILLAIFSLTYAGFLYVKGGKGIDEAKKMFPPILKGFVLMLSAWFIVYQILAWLVKSNTYTVLIGMPK